MAAPPSSCLANSKRSPSRWSSRTQPWFCIQPLPEDLKFRRLLYEAFTATAGDLKQKSILQAKVVVDRNTGSERAACRTPHYPGLPVLKDRILMNVSLNPIGIR
eukprot:1705783-Amphidinium_carterae.1